MNVRELQALRAVIARGTVTRAAEHLGVSQPALSNLIANLERRIGIKLFERAGGRLSPTAEGIHLSDEAEKLLIGLDKLSHLAQDLREQKAGLLRVGCLPGLGIDFVPRLLAGFLADRPNVKLMLQVRTSAEVKEWIAARQFDVGIAELPADEAAIDVDPFSVRCVCVMPQGHPLTAKKRITPKDLSGVPIVTLNRDHMTFFRITRAFEQARAKLNVCAEMHMFAPACTMVASGIGVSIIEPITASTYADRGLECRPFDPPIPFDLGIMYPANRPRSLLAQSFAEVLKDAMSPYVQA
ncbi:MAG TPA: LysR substrate-binding domain-containing protein [Noviherbaspirillum sp.]|nr:LysR substrate-binding domain-containing protein [Noviherbaspirillum sp.]